MPKTIIYHWVCDTCDNRQEKMAIGEQLPDWDQMPSGWYFVMAHNRWLLCPECVEWLQGVLDVRRHGDA